MLPGAILLGILTMLLIVKRPSGAGKTFLVMSMCTPAVVLLDILHDTAIDPTTHNLAPFELVIAWGLGLPFVVPGLAFGLLLRWLAR